MAIVAYNQKLKNNFFLLKILGNYKADIGQFFMIHKDSQSMFLSRPMSVYDIEKDGILFLYKIIGKGTTILAACKAGDPISINGPYGHGFPYNIKGNLALVGGGTGIAPLFFTLKNLKNNNKINSIHVYLGLEEKNDFENCFQKYTNNLIVKYGGFITDYIQYKQYQTIFSCGPEIMMKKIQKKSQIYHIEHYVSLEKRMACGIGACLVCSCKTKKGNLRVCKDGPVFPGGDIFYE